MAKTRAQRKAERRRREQRRERRAQDRVEEAEREGQAQHDTQLGVSGDVAEAEAVIETGASPEEYGEHTVERDLEAPPSGDGSPVPGVIPSPVRPEPPAPEAPAPSRADVGQPDQAEAVPEELPSPAPARETREERRARRQREKEERRRARAKQLRKGEKAQPAERAERRRGGAIGFLSSCWAELKRVQWPDRDTLIQASAVTFVFVAVCAAYLGALDAAFNWLIKQIL
jgi:preprotein translocase SecE subunit